MKSLIKTGDIIIIGIILFAAACLFLFRYTVSAREKNPHAQILVDGEIVRDINLSAADEEEIIEMCGCVICVDSCGICFTEANCPDQICVHSGKITNVGEMAACVPNKIMIRITGSGDLDAVTY